MAAMPPRASLLVETDWLAEHLADERLRVVDIRGSIKPPTAPKPWYAGKRQAYLEAHIPGAVFVDWTEDIVEPDAPVHMALAGPQRFKALMERLGIGDDSEVVVYDDTGGLAPRLWWALSYYGHSAVRLLNGGWPKWTAEGRPVTAAPPAPHRAVFTPRVEPGWRVGPAEVRDAIRKPRVALVDCRSLEEWRGETGRGAKTGRIPGSRNVPAGTMLEGDFRTWRSGEAIRDLYAAAGITSEQNVITYCNAGVSSSVGLFGLRLAGFPTASNFAGSWYEWEADPSHPIETG